MSSEKEKKKGRGWGGRERESRICRVCVSIHSCLGGGGRGRRQSRSKCSREGELVQMCVGSNVFRVGPVMMMMMVGTVDDQ